MENKNGQTLAKLQKDAKLEADILGREVKQAFLQEQEAAHKAIADYTFSDFTN